MLEQDKIIEKIGEALRGNIRYDLELSFDKFRFFLAKHKKEQLFEKKLEKSINRKITEDDKL